MKEKSWLYDFDIDRTIGGLALLKVNYIGNVIANNILNSAIKYLKEYKEKEEQHELQARTNQKR